MKRGQRISIACLALAVICGVLALKLYTGNEEPVYNGHYLGWWLDTWYCDGPRRIEAEQAIRNIGTNALPTLLRWISYNEPHWRQALATRLAKPGTRTTPLQRLATGTAGWRAREAGAAFRLLGTNAYPAVLDLAGLVRSNRSSFALITLMFLGGGHSHVAWQGLTNRNPTVRANAVFYFGNYAFFNETAQEINWATVTQNLAYALQDKSPEVRIEASNALRRIAPVAIPFRPLEQEHHH